MSSTMRPKPRPRPRPRAPATAPINTEVPPSSSPGPSSSATSVQQQQLTPAPSTIEDEDALFLRNQTRTAQAWKQISKMNQEKVTRKRKSSSGDSSDEENRSESSPRSRNRKKKVSNKKSSVLPEWTTKRRGELTLSSDSDDDILVENKSQQPAWNSGKGSSPQSKNNRARSRSITPPPALPQYAIQRAREAVQQLVGSRPRAPSPSDIADDSIDTIVLDPELASIARRVQSEALREGTPAIESGGPEVVRIRIAWKPHPLNPDSHRKSWDVTQKRHDNFYPLFGEIADLASIRVKNLIVCYEGKRVFPSSNPHSIGIWAEAELEACDTLTHEYIQENKRIRSPSVAPAGGDASRLSPSHPRSPSVTPLADPDSGGEEYSVHDEQGESNTFHLTIRSERTQDRDISLLVRPTTKCGAIVRAFLKKAGLEAEYSMDVAPTKGRGRAKAATQVPALSVDGDRMDPNTEIGEADLDDGDLVEVVGL